MLTADIVIIGTSIAYQLALRGATNVVILERDTNDLAFLHIQLASENEELEELPVT